MANRKGERWVTDNLRRKIVDNEYRSGERITESLIAEEFGVSRTPARSALRTLESEGLVKKRDGRGYDVADVESSSWEDVARLRAVLEGLGARTLAERGLSSRTEERLTASLAATEQVARASRLTPELLEAFRVANAIFHETIMRDSGNEALIFAHDRLKNLPLYGLNVYAPNAEGGAPSLLHLAVSHGQHAIVFRAIIDGDGARAEAVMREHRNAGLDYGEVFAPADREGVGAW